MYDNPLCIKFCNTLKIPQTLSHYITLLSIEFYNLYSSLPCKFNFLFLIHRVENGMLPRIECAPEWCPPNHPRSQPSPFTIKDPFPLLCSLLLVCVPFWLSFFCHQQTKECVDEWRRGWVCGWMKEGWMRQLCMWEGGCEAIGAP